MKKLRILFLLAVFIISCLGTALSEQNPYQKNIDTAQNLRLGDIYELSSNFGLIGAVSEKGFNNYRFIYCNNNDIVITINSSGRIEDITYKTPEITLYNMKIGETLWNDSITDNDYFVKQEISPNGKTVYKEYKSDINHMIYRAVFATLHYKMPPRLTAIEKIYADTSQQE